MIIVTHFIRSEERQYPILNHWKCSQSENLLWEWETYNGEADEKNESGIQLGVRGKKTILSHARLRTLMGK